MKKSSYIHANPQAKVCTDVLIVSKILSNCARYNILVTLLLSEEAGREACVKEVAHAIAHSPSSTSHQIALLEAHGIIEGTKRGQQVCYSITHTPLAERIRRIIKVFNS